MSIEEILDQPIFLNQHRLDFSSCFFIVSQPGIFQTSLPLLGTFVEFCNQVLSPLRHFSRN